jgi:hypothetical protein
LREHIDITMAPIPLRNLPADHALSPEEAAEAIHHSVKLRTVQDAAAARDLATHKIGRTILTTVADVRAWWNNCKRPPKCPDPEPHLALFGPDMRFGAKRKARFTHYLWYIVWREGGKKWERSSGVERVNGSIEERRAADRALEDFLVDRRINERRDPTGPVVPMTTSSPRR